MGACRPTWQELEPELVRSSVVVADSRAACMQESGDVILSKVSYITHKNGNVTEKQLGKGLLV